MKKIILFLMVTSLFIFIACEPDAPTQPTDESINANTLVLRKLVTVGNSLTAGFQSSGLVEDFQMNSYPYLIAQQMGQAATFEQPIIAAPGIGSPAGYGPQEYNAGVISQDPLTVDPFSLLSNALLSRAYDNLGIPGADLHDALNSLTMTDNGNPFTSIVLRNPNFGNVNQIDQALGLGPTLLLLWLGNNDVLGAALDGGDLTQITSAADFQSRLTEILTYIRVTQGYDKGLVMANIPDVNDIPYINTVDRTFHNSPALGIMNDIPVVFDQTFTPVIFDTANGGLYIPLLTTETSVVHITLPGLLAYQSGIGVPDSTALRGMGLSAAQASGIVAGMIASGLNPTGTPFDGSMTITQPENVAIANAVTGFNQIIAGLATTFQVPVMDANAKLAALNSTGVDGFSGLYVLLSPTTTAFSLDGVHPNNAGYAIIANGFINTINAAYGQSIPTLTTSNYGGQYTTALPKQININAMNGVRELFRNK
jgi:lysophospholipase L1-like esterase